MKIAFTLLFLLIIALPAVFPAEKMTIAVLDLEAEGVPSIVAKAVSDIVRTEFVKIDNFKVIERSQIDKILDEMEFQLSDLADESQAVKIGELSSAKKIILGQVSALGDKVVITLRIVDVETGESEYSAQDTAPDIDAVDTVAVKLAREFAQTIVSGNKEFFTALSPSVYYTQGIIPGLGQFYADRPVNGVASGILVYGSAGFAGWAYYNYTQKRAAYDAGQFGSNFDTLSSDLQFSSYMFYGSLALIGAAYIYNWIDIAFISKPDFGENRGNNVDKKAQEPIKLSFYLQPGQEINAVQAGLNLSW